MCEQCRRVTRERYLAICAEYGEPGDQAGWAALWDLLRGRRDWNFEPPDRMFGDELAGDPEFYEPAWCFGPPPHTCHLAMYPVDGKYVLYLAREDADTEYDDLAPVEAWLDAHEDEHREMVKSERDSLELLHRYDDTLGGDA